MATASPPQSHEHDGREPGRMPHDAVPQTASATALPRGPRAHPFVQTLAWAFAPTWVMDRCARRIGESFTLTFWPSRMQLVVVSGPEAVKTVFTAPGDIAPSSAGDSPVRPVMGPSSVIVLTGPEHMRQRKLLLLPFHGERMREYEDAIVQETRRDMASWPLGQPMRVQERTRAITLNVILRVVFGVEAERMELLRDAIGGLLAPVNPLRLLAIALRRPSMERPGGAFGRALDRLDAAIYDELARRRAQPDLSERTDILSLLMLARDDDGEAMTDGELRDELVTLLLAGHETTATSVAWAVERLVRHPDKLTRLVAEIDAGPDAGERYMNAVVNETLRIRPVVPIVARKLNAELEVDGRVLPAGTRVTPSIYLTNRSARTYAEPERFVPERFLDGAPDTFAWIPFGGGIRRCIGASFAQLEMKLMLRTMLAELEPSVAPGRRNGADEKSRRRAITLVPSRGARVVWRRRATAG